MKEYKIIEPSIGRLQNDINALAKEGWVVHTLTIFNKGFGSFCYVLLEKEAYVARKENDVPF